MKGIRSYFHKHKIAETLFIILVSLFLGFYFLGDNLAAKFWIIDDHQIIEFLGSDFHLELSEIPELLKSRIVNDFSKSVRVRPTYYTLRILETFLWGNNPFL